MNPKSQGKIILAGGTWFLGNVLSAHFAAQECEVVILTRNPRAGGGAREVRWDGQTLGEWANELDGAFALINLAGVSVNCRYHERNRRLILDSRINSTRVLGEAINRCANPPPVWLNSSTATIYRHTFGPAWDESGEIGGTPAAKDEFSVDVAIAWEKVLNEANTPRTRKIALRAAMVLGRGRNSVFPMLRRLARFGLGGRMADGKQFVSWVHQEDFCRAIDWLLKHKEISGVVNLAAPNPLSNAEMMRAVREVCGAWFGLPAERWMLDVGAFFLRTETELIIKSRRVVSKRLAENGFAFRFPTFREAILELTKQIG
jgi:uncharacterized protein